MQKDRQIERYKYIKGLTFTVLFITALAFVALVLDSMKIFYQLTSIGLGISCGGLVSLFYKERKNLRNGNA